MTILALTLRLNVIFATASFADCVQRKLYLMYADEEAREKLSRAVYRYDGIVSSMGNTVLKTGDGGSLILWITCIWAGTIQ